MRHNKRILLIDNVISLSSTNLRLRERLELTTILGTKKYHSYMVFSDPVLLSKLRKSLRTNTFFDSRIETYRVPSLTIGTLASNRLFGKVGKIMFGICNIFLQSIYLLHLTMLVLCLVLAKKIDLMHAHNPPDLTGFASLLVSKITHVPYIFEIHDRTPELYSGEMGLSESSLVFNLMKSIEHLVVVNSEGIITVNGQVATYFKQYGGPTPVAIYTGTKIDAPELEKTQFENKKLRNKRIILYQGSLNMTAIGEPATYDLELPLNVMPDILNNFPDSVLVYVGEGSGRTKLEKRSKVMGLSEKVFFTGFISKTQVFDWIKKAEILLIPYSDNPNCHTTVPSKLYEYMAIGKPIVATRFPGISEILKHEHNGLLYTINSMNDFSSCVFRLLNDPELAEKLSSNARRDFISKYSQDRNWQKLISLYDSILD